VCPREAPEISPAYESEKESRSSVAPSIGESLVHQYTDLAPSPFFAITHQTSEHSGEWENKNRRTSYSSKASSFRRLTTAISGTTRWGRIVVHDHEKGAGWESGYSRAKVLPTSASGCC
jgi:hypothetical protein